MPSNSPAQPVESVWDYPRPPRLEPTSRHLRILHAGIVHADTTRALSILETSHPPIYYFPQSDILIRLLRPSRVAAASPLGNRSIFWSERRWNATITSGAGE